MFVFSKEIETIVQRTLTNGRNGHTDHGKGFELVRVIGTGQTFRRRFEQPVEQIDDDRLVVQPKGVFRRLG